MLSEDQKEVIIYPAIEEAQRKNAWEVENIGAEVRSFISFAKEAITEYRNRRPEKQNNKLSECMGRHNEAMNQRYNHNTRRYEKF